MFQFPRLPSCAYVFSAGGHRITGARFPHSGIRGSKPVQRLTAAYRSRPRPSSTPGAKASTMCPYYLDGDRLMAGAARHRLQTVIFRLMLTNCAVFKVRRGRNRRDSPAGLSKLSSTRPRAKDGPRAIRRAA
jgi:hypothetical protein